ncbi:acetyl-CoA C-acetyltransferase [Cupriavidus sp. IK-TO18]|uniref:acetyl-CoA C-acetyltransferase n=1 Tax=Cupriavidus sp. IK-TO18 TaxID=2782182 RepID=UPI00189B6458|nr:acetyl-CoA C-acetyltransferase [Cupriavidus sp. IK-TO18]MBF6990793.1 acetyl-CoA C-acetyltransferase [Cupriavidus sp. IK-TO18]
MTEAFIYDAVRTPRGKGKPGAGALYEVKPIDLVVTLLEALRQRHDLDPARVDDLIMGISSAVGDQGSCLPRIAALCAPGGWTQVPGMALQRFCGAGLEALNIAAEKVRSGWHDLIAAGGVESMSRLGLGASGGAWIYDPATSLKIAYVPQGFSADMVAALHGFCREQLDEYALRSQALAAAARREGHFARSLVPVRDASGLVMLDHDEYIREETTAASLASLKPAFGGAPGAANAVVARQRYPELDRIDAVHTAGNSSGIVDGAGLVLIGSERIGQELGLRPRARILGTGLASVEATLMLTGPVPATQKALAKAGLRADQIDLFEVNEAFAAVPLHFAKTLEVPLQKVNVNGGSIAMGHPIGATGAIIVGTLLDELERRQQRYGVATLCVAGGMGVATVIERL